MSVTEVFLDILIVLLVAKAAAEVAERIHLPAVVTEILAGIAIGPTALGLVSGPDEVLHVLGELGIILLLLDVGMEMDLGQLAAVGRASMSVALLGVAVPFAGGWASALALGMDGNEAMFVGAALTATSVGITARVFGDLRALATVEARTVLGAAVADDVIGLVILTVVVRLGSEGHVAPLSVVGIVAVAIGFLVVTSVCGVQFAPRLFTAVDRYSRSSGTLVAVALAFTLAVATLASAARLAPIVGAFVAGLALSRCSVAPRIRRELTPVGHLFIPVFFLQIGIDAEVDNFADASVLGTAGVLLAVAIVGKLISAAGLWGRPGDRLLVGMGMIPRGEVGLIFATLGLREGIFGPDIYAALLLVVLASTLIAPPLLRHRLLRIRANRVEDAPAPKPPGGWLAVTTGRSGSTVDLAAAPPPGEALALALEVALLGEKHQPGPKVLDWLGGLPDTPLQWNGASRALLVRLLEEGGPRGWRFLALTGILTRALPELGAALDRRQADPFELDPTAAMRWPLLSEVRRDTRWRELRHPEWLLLAAVILDATDGAGEPRVVVARKVIQRLDLGAAAEQAVAGLVADVELLPAAARRLDGLDEEPVLQLAVHLRSADQARAAAILAEVSADLADWERERLRQLHHQLQAVLAHPEITGREAANAVEQRRAAARRMSTNPVVHDRIDAAPRAYVLATSADQLVAHASLCEPPPARDELRVQAETLTGETHRIDVVARDRVGLLAAVAHVLASAGLDVRAATVATWGDRCVLASFEVASSRPPRADALEADLREALRRPPSRLLLADAVIEFDDAGSPWHTICRITAHDRKGALHAIAAAFAGAGASVHSAKVATVGSEVVDLFELTDRSGYKLSPTVKETIVRSLGGRTAEENGRRGSLAEENGTAKDFGKTSARRKKQSGDQPEITSQ